MAVLSNGYGSINPTIVMVPGAWQLPKAWDTVACKLNALNYRTKIVPNLSVGSTTTPKQGLADDAANLHSVIQSIVNQQKDVVIIGHSYGGEVMSSAVQGLDQLSRKAAGLKGGVIMMAWWTALVVEMGKTALDALGGSPFPWMVVQDDEVSADPNQIIHIAFNDLNPVSAAYWANQTTYSSLSAFTEPNTYEPWQYNIPRSYVFHTLDNAIPLVAQQAMASLLGANTSTFSLEAGHCSFLSIPSQATETIVNIAKIGVAKKA